MQKFFFILSSVFEVSFAFLCNFIMQYQVLVQNQTQNGFVASVIGIPGCDSEGRTKEEAVAAVKAALAEKLTQSELITIDMDLPSVSATEHPLLKHFGRFKDDPTFDDNLEEIAKYRRELDAEEEARRGNSEETQAGSAG